MNGSRTRTRFESILDFEGVAALIDTVAGAGPARLGTLLRVLSSSEERLEARVVVELALRCRDPLAPLATLCRDALRTAADFDSLLRSQTWRSVRQHCPKARATALLNLCDEILAGASPRQRRRHLRCRQIRPLLEIAAVEEQSTGAEDLESLEAARAAQCPSYWQQLGNFLARIHATPA